MCNSYFLGIDTSNYKTSIAIVDEDNNIIVNIQEFLDVKKGERGLRQSAALFQHINKLPALIEKALNARIDIRNSLKAVAVSNRPRPYEDSYMPVFNGGVTVASVIASSLNIPLFKFSHQEGHIAAVKTYSPLKDFKDNFVSFHFSGGTTEAIFVGDNEYKIVGGTKDIAYGQVLDRVGVSLNMSFPCGKQMDEIAINAKASDRSIFPKIKVDNGFINLSGIETKAQKNIDIVSSDILIRSLFDIIARSIVDISIMLCNEMKVNDFIFAGGVSSSTYIRNYLQKNLSNLNLYFGEPALSTDNAVGIAILGGQAYGN